MADYINENFVAEVPRNPYYPEKTAYDCFKNMGNEASRMIPITTTYLILNSIMGKNTLIEGGSGTAKTHLASVVASTLSQLPYEFFERRKITGIPGVSVNDIYATTDLAELQKGKDVAFLYQSAYSPTLIIDELNRFDEFAQNKIREGIASHVWQYANHSWKIPGQIVIATINPETYGGTFILNENLIDNFSLVLEPPYFNLIVHEDIVLNSRFKVKEKLGLEKLVDKLDFFYERNKNNCSDILKKISEIQDETIKKFEERGVPFVHNGKLEIIRNEINGIEIDPEARLFIYSMLSEANWSKQFGRVRYEDPRSNSSHDRNYVQFLNKESFAGRVLQDLESTTKMIAWYSGKEKADSEDVKGAFIYTTPRRIKPHAEFYQECLNANRNLPINHEMARKLIETAWSNFVDFKGARNENLSFQRCREAIIRLQKGDHTGAVDVLEKTDHPLASTILEAIAVNSLKNKQKNR